MYSITFFFKVTMGMGGGEHSTSAIDNSFDDDGLPSFIARHDENGQADANWKDT